MRHRDEPQDYTTGAQPSPKVEGVGKEQAAHSTGNNAKDDRGLFLSQRGGYNRKPKGRIRVAGIVKARPIMPLASLFLNRRHHRSLPVGPNLGMIGLRLVAASH